MQQDKFEEALADAAVMMALDAYSPLGFHCAGMAHEATQNTRAAFRAFSQAFELGPSNRMLIEALERSKMDRVAVMPELESLQRLFSHQMSRAAPVSSECCRYHGPTFAFRGGSGPHCQIESTKKDLYYQNDMRPTEDTKSDFVQMCTERMHV